MNAARHLLAAATARLSAAGVGSARVDAELLLADALGTTRSRAIVADVPDDVAERFEAYVRRRVAREPLQHIVGTAAFRHVVLAVGPGVFVPRPETELLVDAVLPHLHAVEQPLVVDLCSGSGALAVALAHEVPAAHVVAVERAAAALGWLGRNAGDRVEIRAGDIRDDQLLADLSGRADAVVSNPPYVPAATPVDPEVRADPAEAVFAGADGLDLMPSVLHRAAVVARSGAILAVEHDETQADRVVELCAADGRWVDVRSHRDLAGRPRFVTARRAMADG